MARSLLADAFGHHVWATLRLIDACAAIPPAQLETSAIGTYGPIIGTLRHTVGADSGYLFALTGGRVARIDEEAMTLAELRDEMARHGREWEDVLARELDPNEVVVRRRDDGSETHAPVGIRLAQALHHGTDHRSQVCTALTSLGVEPPAIDVWDFGAEAGTVVERAPASA